LSQGPVVVVGIDAGNLALLRSYARAGHLPRIARALDSAACARIEHEPGLFVGSIWPTMLTGTGADRHGFYTGIRPAPRSYDYVVSPVQADPFWEPVAAAGHRVAVIDAPFFPVRPRSGVDHIVEGAVTIVTSERLRRHPTSSTP
jgi:predicted AlkP superfamily phosphohydrolase/phosphomutase